MMRVNQGTFFDRIRPPPILQSRIPLTLITVIAAACGQRTTSGATMVSTSDSAGIVIVENGTIESLPQWAVPTEAQVSIGSRDAAGPDGFVAVTGALRLANGGIVVSDAAAGEIRLFDSTGRFLRLIARRGSGPGEVTHPDGLRWLSRDTFYVVDRLTRRAVLFDETGQMLTTVPVANAIVTGNGFSALIAIGLLSSMDAAATISIATQPQQKGARYHATLQLLRVAGDGKVRDTILTVKGKESYMISFNQPGFPPLAADAVVYGSDTKMISTRHRIYVGETSEPIINEIDESGKPLRSIRWAQQPLPVTDNDRREYFIAESTMAKSEAVRRRGQTDELMERARERVFAQIHPVFDDLVVADNGDLWVSRMIRDDAGTRRELVAFDSTGRGIGRLAVGADLRLFAIGLDYLLAGWRDEDDVDFIRLYRFRRSASR